MYPQNSQSYPWILKGGALFLSALQVFASCSMAAYAQNNTAEPATRTPIKHVIVIIGENRTFDHIYATYKPKAGETVDNLLSKGIVNADGTPGPNYALATQFSAVDTASEGYQISPMDKSLLPKLPVPIAGGPATVSLTVAQAQALENGIPNGYYKYMTTGGTGLKSGTPDTRVENYNNLPPGPFQITKGIPYDAYAGSPVHRFYQMWQQSDCNVEYATVWNPSGCKADLFPWVGDTVGSNENGRPQPQPFTDTTTHEGGNSMGFYNMQQGDAPVFKLLADNFAMSDNYHQAVMGGTGANHIMLGTGDMIWYSDGMGNAAVPPHNQLVAAGTPNAGVVDEIEDPNAQPGTNNWYTQDGYGGGSYGSPSYGGGSYTDCADPNAPGVAPILTYLGSLPRKVDSRCAAGHYYILNNYNPGYYGNGQVASTDTTAGNTVFTVPPSTVRNIGDALLEKNISWKYYGDQWNQYKANPDGNYVDPADQYCNICNFFQYSTSIMTNAAVRDAHLKDTTDLYSDIQNGTLPAVSFVKPSGYVDGHPASSKLDLYELYVLKIVAAVKANPELWKDTAIVVTVDEGGGYYDSGYIQPVDYFGDGTRIPLIVVSRYTKPGHISHEYTDHVSILKFIEANWGLAPITGRSRDNLPNPVQTGMNPYAPVNGPAIGDLMGMFDFSVK